MDVCESNQALETPRQPLVSAEKTNGTTRRPRIKEVSSRYKSPTPRRCPSPSTTRTVTAPSATIPKRAVSAERRRPATPPSPPSHSTPVHDTSVDTEMAARKVTSSRMPESLWPSRMRSLSVSFQSDTFSFPISKREKPPPQVLSDRTLKPSSNVSHKQTVTPTPSRKATPERKRSPLKGKNAIDQLENSRPLDGLHARLVDQHRWPSKTGSNVLSKSIDHPDKAVKTATILTPGVGAPSLRRMSIPDYTSKPLQKSISDAVLLLSALSDNGRSEFDNSQRTSNLVSSSSSEKTALVTPGVRSQCLPTPGSRPSSPNKPYGVASRGVSPSRARASSPAPSRGVSPVPSRGVSPVPSRGVSPVPVRGVSPVPVRGVSPVPSRGLSPSRIRSSSPARQSNNPNPVSVLTFIADIKKGKKVANHVDDAHCLRLLYNRQVQWRFVNAGAEAVLNSQKVTAENDLFNVWRTTLELRDTLSAMKIDLYQLRLQLRLKSVLKEQMAYLNEWASIEREHDFALSGATEDLQASTLRLPVTGGATADIETLKLAVYSAVQVMQMVGSSIHSMLSMGKHSRDALEILSTSLKFCLKCCGGLAKIVLLAESIHIEIKLEGTNGLVSELASVAAQERALLDECETLLASAAALQVEEYSLRTHLIQLQQAWKSV